MKKEPILIKCEIHCHSSYSSDGHVSPQEIIDICLREGMGAIALTDHNTIDGAVELKRLAPRQLVVVIGEEVRSANGDIIGLFLSSGIEPGMSAIATIQEIKRQGGLVLVPHPFDVVRRDSVGPKVLSQIKEEVDFLEIFNGRNLFSRSNIRAEKFAKHHKLKTFVGSDAHTKREYGLITCLMEPFSSREEFANSLSKAEFLIKSRLGRIDMVMEGWRKVQKRFRD